MNRETEYERLIGYDVIDKSGNKIGTVNNLWVDQNHRPEFIGVKTGWLFGKNHVVSVHTTDVNHKSRIIRLPFSEDKIKNAPSFDADADLSDTDDQQVYRYYDLQPQQFQPSQQPGQQAMTREEANIKLSEEQVKVGKREVSAGGVRLRKIVRTETVQQPIELKREEIVIERVPASGTQPAETSFEAQDIFIPLRREEPVVQKEACVKEEVRVGKKVETERQTISEQVRKEDVEIEGAEKPQYSTELGAERQSGRYEQYERLIGYDVIDKSGNKIGTVNNLWVDQNHRHEFIGVKTGWLFGKNPVVSVHTADVNHKSRTIRLPFSEDKIKNAPSFDADADLSDTDDQQVYRYYGLQPQQFQPSPQPGQQATTHEEANIKLSEEQVKVGKREVSAGGVRLRKIVRTETVQQPVELKREEIVIEHVPASGTQPAETSFEVQDIFIPLWREEPVVQKEASVKEEVRVGKKVETERQTISEQVRKEDVEIEGAEKPQYSTELGAERQSGRYEQKERLIDYDVIDKSGNKIGTVNNLWVDQNHRHEFIGVKTGWLFGKNPVVSVHTADVNHKSRTIRLPFSEDKIKNAPSFDADADLSDTDDQQVYRYYGLHPQQFQP